MGGGACDDRRYAQLLNGVKCVMRPIIVMYDLHGSVVRVCLGY